MINKVLFKTRLIRAALCLYFKHKEEILVSAIVAHADYFAKRLRQETEVLTPWRN
jgi:hypothetical protein